MSKVKVEPTVPNGDGPQTKTEPESATVPLSSFGLPRLYRDVEITLDNNLLPVEKLTNPPSLADGLDLETENRLRFLGCELIQTASILLKLPQVAAASGQLLYQRFYYCKSFIRCDFESVAMACVVLASKIEESSRKLRDVINVFNHIKQLRTKRKPTPLVLDQTYVKVKNEVKKQERRVLKELGFCVHIKHPHKLIVTYLKLLELESDDRLLQRAWNYMNDGLRTDIFLRYSAETIACACIYLSARIVKVPLPTDWYEVLDASEVELKAICVTLLKMYSAQRPSWSRLERIVADLRKRFLESQQIRTKGAQEGGSGGEENNTPKETKDFSPSHSRAASPKAGAIVEKKDKGDRRSKSKRSPSGDQPDRAAKRNSKEGRKRDRSRSETPSPKRKRKDGSSRNHSATKATKEDKKRHRRHSSSVDSPPLKPLKQSQKKDKRRDRSRSRSRSSSRERSKRRQQRERELEVRQTLNKRRRSRTPDKPKLTSKYR